jgi:hypothetical protein
MVGTKTACFGAYARASEDAVLSLLAKEGKTIVGAYDLQGKQLQLKNRW